MDDSETSTEHSALRLTLHRLTRGAGIQRKDLLEALTGELSELRQYWGTNLNVNPQENREQALRRARHAIASNLYSHFDSLNPPRGVPRNRYIHALFVCFNIQRDKAHSILKDSDLTERRNWLARQAPPHLRVSHSTSQRYLNDAITQIEQQITQSGYTPANADRRPSDSDTIDQMLPLATADEISGAPFIPRPELAKWLEEVWRIPPSEWEWNRMQRVCVVGDAGTGKSRLVREHTASDNPVWIDAELDESMVAAMADLLSGYEQDTTGLKPGSIRKLFGKLLARTDGPPMVVIDGIPDPVQLDQFLPRNTHARIVITSRQNPRDDDWAPVIRVEDMTSDEAEHMVAVLLPGRTEVECRSLAVTFGCRPLIIEHGCAAFAREGTNDVEGFCRSVSEDAATGIRDIADKADKTDRALTAIYQHLVTRLDREEPEALQLLELLAFVTPQWIPTEFCMAYLLGLPYVKQRQVRFAQRRYDVAVRPLEMHSLIVTDEVLGISIPLLTQRILRGIFTKRKRVVEILPRIQKLVDFTPETLYAEGWLDYTVGGRMACLAAFTLYGIETATDRGRLEFTGEVGSARWGYMTHAIWTRCVAIQSIKRYLLAQVRGERDVDWDAFVESRKHYPRVQLAEAEAVAAAEKRRHSSYEARQPGQRTAPTSARKAAENILDAFYENFGRYEESPLGTLDFGKVPMYFPDELREQFMRDIETISKEYGYNESLLGD